MTTKYLLDGTEVNVIAKTDDGKFVVSEFYDDDFGTYEGSPQVVDHVFDTAPVKRLDEEVQNLNREIEDLKARRRLLLDGIREVEREATKEDSHIGQLRDLLANKFTHVVVFGGSVQTILPLQELKTQQRDRDNVLSLTISKHNRCQWKAHYNDYVIDAYLCQGEIEALQVAQRLIDSECARTSNLDFRTVDLAKKFGLKIPEGHYERYMERRRDDIRRNLNFNRKMASEYAAKADADQKTLDSLAHD